MSFLERWRRRREARAEFDAAVEALGAPPLTNTIDAVLRRLEAEQVAVRSSLPPPISPEELEDAAFDDTPTK